MVLLLLLIWIFGIPMALVSAAGVYVWYRQRRLASLRRAASARVYPIARPTSRFP
jgi:hypothetical protein